MEGGSTKGLHVHLKSVHHIELLKRKNVATIEAVTETKAAKVSKIDHFIQNNTLSAVLARMTACDGFSFSIFITSQDLRKSIMALGHTLPKSVSGIRDQVFKYGSHVIEKIKRDLVLKKARGEKFSLTLDEWTSLRNKSYLNINIHEIGYFGNFGLVRYMEVFQLNFFWRCHHHIKVLRPICGVATWHKDQLINWKFVSILHHL